MRRLAACLLAAAAFAAPARAQPVELMPGVTFDRTVQFTPHGVVVLNVITAPRPGGLYRLAPVLAGGAVAGAPSRLTAIEQSLSGSATVAGINGDFFDRRDGHPAGVVLSGGVLAHPPAAGRSSIGVDAGGLLHVDRVKLFGTWRGTGQRRTLNELDQAPASGQYALFTPAWGPAAPAVPGAAEVVLEPFPAAAPNSDLVSSVVRVSANGGERIPADGAVLMASGSAASAALRAEAPPGAAITVRLGLLPAWTGMVDALGGGPLLVRAGKPVFHSLEDLTNDQVTARDPRAAVGQLADGRILLVAVDGGGPGYSVGLTSYELAKALAGLGAVTACGLEPGNDVAAAFDGRLLSRPAAGERPIREALLVEYAGVYAPDLPLPLLNGDPGRTTEPLVYRLVRPSTVTAQLVAPDGGLRPLESGVQQPPGTYTLPLPALDEEGAWRLRVDAVDDLGRASTAERSFRYDTTLAGLSAPATARGRLTVRFTLSRPASVRLVIETPAGIAARDLGPVALPAGAQSLAWDGRLPGGTPAFPGAYVAHLYATSQVGTSDLVAHFAFRRAG
ncbi:MAG TPA: phosphodiester glycosidase family protein [Gaiellaceae bacterium]|nr:phosphodiester glycosidase family protein [Gaiellaceae bacterium]